MKFEDVFYQIVSDLPKIISDNEFLTIPKVYIGKTEDVRGRTIDHAEKDKLFYLTTLAKGSPKLISELETVLIREFQKPNSKIKLLNDTDNSSGNPQADTLYICFDQYLSSDELGEYSLKLNETYPITIQ